MRGWILAASALLTAGPSPAQNAPSTPPQEPATDAIHEHHTPKRDRASEIERARKYFTDVVLVNQDGENMRLYSDLLHGKTVVINPFFTSCAGVCPILSQKIAAIQDRFPDRLGQDLRLISISVDPETDTPDKLKTYAERFKAKPGWYFVSGSKENVDWALHKLGQYVEDKEAHTNIFIIGNEAAGHWRKALGLDSPEKLIRQVEEVLDFVGADSSGG